MPLYSSRQVTVGTLLGGPVGLIYFLKANFAALGDNRSEKKTVVGGLVLVLALLVILPFLPEKFPGFPFTITYTFIAWYVAQQQIAKANATSLSYDYHSNWQVVGWGLLCFLASVLVILGPLLLLVFLDIELP